MADQDSAECITSIVSYGIGMVMALCFVAVFVAKLWSIEKNEDKVAMFHLDKPVLYFSYFFFLLSAST
ncbi:hypothetical protein, partial [Herbaspirillum sp.]|uniref:hypothetical protein n=1 Tax=Herbaspirillum sp. TaxID=1890675 RepID=UPI002584FF08